MEEDDNQDERMYMESQIMEEGEGLSTNYYSNQNAVLAHPEMDMGEEIIITS